MLHLEQTTEPQTVAIPRNLLPVPGGDYVVTLKNTVDRSRVSIAPSCVTVRPMVYSVTIALADVLPAGEYEYELRKGAATLAVGLLTLGEYRYDNIQYESATSYGQYEE